MRAIIDDRKFMKELNDMVGYSVGYVEGVQRGKKKFLDNLGKSVIEIVKEYIDSNARVNPEALHHVYEWYQTGSPNARLFDIDYTVSNLGLSIKSTFSQSRSVQAGSNVPFYNKAKIMEEGIPVTIVPKQSKVLSFNDNGEEVFVSGPVTVSEPGGQATTGGFQRVLDTFMNKYFSQAFMEASGLKSYLKNPTLYRKSFSSGVKGGGRSLGRQVGYTWIANAGVIR